MPVPTLITDLSTTPASNSPAGSENVFPSLDDYLRSLSAFVASIRTNSATNGWVSPYLPLTGGTLTGPVTFSSVAGDGSGLTGLSAAALSTGIIPAARFPATLPAVSGAQLTSLNAAQLTGAIDPGRLTSVPAANLMGVLPSTIVVSTQPSGTNNNYLATTAYVYAQAFGDTIWQNLGSSGGNIRFKGVTYYNNTGKPICIKLKGNDTNTGGRLALAIGGGILLSDLTAFTSEINLFAVIPPFVPYTVYDFSGNISIASWQELRT